MKLSRADDCSFSSGRYPCAQLKLSPASSAAPSVAPNQRNFFLDLENERVEVCFRFPFSRVSYYLGILSKASWLCRF